MKPMVPVTATAAPTPSATPAHEHRSRPTSTPRLDAVSSPSLSARKAALASSMIAPAMMNGNASMTC